jgi:hypothetical protein
MRPPTPDGSSGAGRIGMPATAGFLAAPLAEALAVLPPRPGSLADAGVSAGGCFVRPLPADTTCASAARRLFREALSSLPIPSGLLHDGVTMASELAANTLHAQRKAAASGLPRTPTAGPEIWVYLRGDGRRCELVCKVFDSERAFEAADQPGLAKAPVDSVSGRGLQVVDGLSAGQWGCHPTLSRLGPWKTPGKAVWFALRVPPAVLPDDLGRPRYSPDWLVDELEAMLADRGLTDIVRADAAGLSVLSISRHLTVWRRVAMVSWRMPSGQYQQLDLADLMEVSEQIVWAHEEAAIAETYGYSPGRLDRTATADSAETDGGEAPAP